MGMAAAKGFFPGVSNRPQSGNSLFFAPGKHREHIARIFCSYPYFSFLFFFFLRWSCLGNALLFPFFLLPFFREGKWGRRGSDGEGKGGLEGEMGDVKNASHPDVGGRKEGSMMLCRRPLLLLFFAFVVGCSAWEEWGGKKVHQKSAQKFFLFSSFFGKIT